MRTPLAAELGEGAATEVAVGAVAGVVAAMDGAADGDGAAGRDGAAERDGGGVVQALSAAASPTRPIRQRIGEGL